MVNIGSASPITTMSAKTAGRMGRRWMKSAQRGQKPVVELPTTRGPFSLRFLRCFRLMTRGPMKPKRAGNSVKAAIIVHATPREAAMARPYRKLTPRANMPSRAMHTMMPANNTARPEVFTAVTMESSTELPAIRPCRCRVTMNRA